MSKDDNLGEKEIFSNKELVETDIYRHKTNTSMRGHKTKLISIENTRF